MIKKRVTFSKYKTIRYYNLTNKEIEMKREHYNNIISNIEYSNTEDEQYKHTWWYCLFKNIYLFF